MAEDNLDQPLAASSLSSFSGCALETGQNSTSLALHVL